MVYTPNFLVTLGWLHRRVQAPIQRGTIDGCLARSDRGFETLLKIDAFPGELETAVHWRMVSPRVGGTKK
jgi:hypothetical protein